MQKPSKSKTHLLPYIRRKPSIKIENSQIIRLFIAKLILFKAATGNFQQFKTLQTLSLPKTVPVNLQRSILQDNPMPNK